MRKIKCLLIMIIAVMASASCSDDNNGNNDEANLVGSWVFTEIEDGVEYYIGVRFNSDFTGFTTSIETEDGERETFGSFFTYSTNEDQLTITIGGDIEVYTYSISANTLSLKEDGYDAKVYTKA